MLLLTLCAGLAVVAQPAGLDSSQVTNQIVLSPSGVELNWSGQLPTTPERQKLLQRHFGFDSAFRFNAVQTSNSEDIIGAVFHPPASIRHSAGSNIKLWDFAFELLSKGQYKERVALETGWQKSRGVLFNHIQGFYVMPAATVREFSMLFSAQQDRVYVVLMIGPADALTTLRTEPPILLLPNP